MAVGGRSSVVRALAAQASDLDSIPDGFPVLFHIPLFSLCLYQYITNYLPGYIEPSKAVIPMPVNICGVLILVIFVVDLAVTKFFHLRKVMPRLCASP